MYMYIGFNSGIGNYCFHQYLEVEVVNSKSTVPIHNFANLLHLLYYNYVHIQILF